jgi:DNA (cytosine-5)-methyltransferase 1
MGEVENISATLDTDASQKIAGEFGVRRLTPTECEALQGFPRGWTGIPGASDSTRYKQLGNAVTVNVLEWLGKRIMEVTNK